MKKRLEKECEFAKHRQGGLMPECTYKERCKYQINRESNIVFCGMYAAYQEALRKKREKRRHHNL